METLRVVVTGGSGFVGTAIVSALVEKYPQYEVIIFDKHPGIQDGLPGARKQYVKVDVTSLVALKDAFDKSRPDIVIHTAGVIPPLSERYARRLEVFVKQVNVDGTRNVVETAIQFGCRALVYTSSCCAVTDDVSKSYANIDETWPVSRRSLIYGESKVEAEELVLAANSASFATCVLRPSVIFGEGDQQLIPSIHACIAKRETPYKLGNGFNLWDTVYVGNVAEAHLLAMENLLESRSAAGEVIFVQNNEPVSFREFTLAVWKEFDHYPPFEVQIPESFGRFVGWVAEWYTWFSGTPTTISRGSVQDACAMRYASGNKAKKLLGYSPTVDLEEGIRRSCQVSLRRRNV